MKENSAHSADIFDLSMQIQGLMQGSAGSGEVRPCAGLWALSCYLDVILLVTGQKPFS
jgi:hypothetical protein